MLLCPVIKVALLGTDFYGFYSTEIFSKIQSIYFGLVDVFESLRS